MFEEKGEKERSYVLGYGIEALEEEGKEYYYHKDERNSTTYLSNERREIENRYAYDGYGRSQRKDEGVENAIQYTGQRYEEELEGYCLGVREYREEYGRFLTEDAYEGDGTNLYAYCRNNPIKYYDPSGYSGETNQTEKGHTTLEGEEGKTPSAGTEGGNGSTKISSEMREKILEGQRKDPLKNEVIEGHSSKINNENDIFAVELVSENADEPKNIKFIKDFQDGNISKIKKSTIFPDLSWSESKIITSIEQVGNSPIICVQGRDGATFHRAIVGGVEIDVIKIGNNVVSGYSTGKVNAPKPSGF